jgi:hypothetical protein
MSAFFDLPLNLPHAGTIAKRILAKLEEHDAPEAKQTVLELVLLLAEPRMEGENPPEPDAERMRLQALELTRRLVSQIESGGLGDDRLGQHVRNLFECLSEGAEGARESLRAGEDPNSPMRPRPADG